MPKKSKDNEPSGFWKRLTETWARAGKPTSQSGVAKELGAGAQSTTQRWHDGTALPKKDMLIAIADRGNTTLDYLIAGRLPKNPVKRGSLLDQLLTVWNELDEEDQRHILKAAKGQHALRDAEPPQPDRDDRRGAA